MKRKGKNLRAQRFGLPININNNDDEASNRKRVGGGKDDTEEEEKKRKRAERFGLVGADEKVNSSKADSSSNPPALTLTDEEKKRKRAERFGAESAVNQQPNKKVKET